MIKNFKDKKIALIGAPLSHSYSKKLHSFFADYDYSLLEISRGELESTLKNTRYDGFNVTIPYKEAVIPFLDDISEEAKEIGSVNTVIRQDGKLFGLNTDYYGFVSLLEKYKIDLKGKKVMILGSGGASKAVRLASESAGCAEIVVVSRTGEDNYSNLYLHDNTDIIVNTTPVGMYPDFENAPLSLEYFKNLECVIDIIYNPSRTELMSIAEENGSRAVGGLWMLVCQAAAATEIFTGKSVSKLSLERAYRELSFDNENIILVGMPGSGKSSVAAELSKILDRPLFDTDRIIEEESKLSIPEIFELYGEEYFRTIEAQIIKKVSILRGAVTATGGGAILREDNIREIRRNSKVVFLRRPEEELEMTGRPLSSTPDRVREIAKRRLPLYTAASDIIVDVQPTAKETAKAVIKAIYDYYASPENG